ncbi:MAG: hypothetical protein VYE65_05990, partial [SAR324 cluster bacterium]|nr:hypothetical protein [SAR324 cluster bacterium]
MKNILYIILITCFSLAIFSCGKKDDGSSGSPTAGTNGSTSEGGSSYSCSFKNTKAFIVGNAVTEKCMWY